MSPRRHDYRPAVSYTQAHLRLKTDRGRADAFNCVNCGGAAREWAYMGGCPDELTADNGVKYSLDQTRYEPMCTPCHRRHDRAVADGRSTDVCPSGHPWNEENTGIRIKRSSATTGLRFCRACNRAHARAWRERKAVA